MKFPDKSKANVVCFLIAVVVSLSSCANPKIPEIMISESDPVRINYKHFQEQFGRDETIIISVTPPDIFNQNFLKKLKTFHEEIEKKVPYLSKVKSLINARVTRSDNDHLYVNDLLGDWTEKQVDLTKIKKQVLSNPAYINDIISKDGKTTSITINTVTLVDSPDSDQGGYDYDDFENEEINNQPLQYFSQKENQKVLLAISDLVNKYNIPGFSITVFAGPFVFDDLNRSVSDIYSVKQNFKDLTMLEVIVDTGKENGVFNTRLLKSIDKLCCSIEKYENRNIYVEKVFSINDILKETNQAINKNDPSFYIIPDQNIIIPQLFLLFENSGSDDLENFADNKFSKTRISIKTTCSNRTSFKDFISNINKQFTKEFSGKAEIVFTGGMTLISKAISQ